MKFLVSFDADLELLQRFTDGRLLNFDCFCFTQVLLFHLELWLMSIQPFQVAVCWHHVIGSSNISYFAMIMP
jgi:hypothetical protein